MIFLKMPSDSVKTVCSSHSQQDDVCNDLGAGVSAAGCDDIAKDVLRLCQGLLHLKSARRVCDVVTGARRNSTVLMIE